VADARVNLASETAWVEGSAAAAPLVAAVERAGYAVRRQVLRLAVSSMTCASCVGRVERTLLKQPGVLSAEVNLANETARRAAGRCRPGRAAGRAGQGRLPGACGGRATRPR
jgi:Cu+-exporting ATPase